MKMRSEERRRRRAARARARGMFLLEILVVLGLIAGSVLPLLMLRDECTRKSYAARNANLARNLARELLSEIEFHNLETLSGAVEGYPGFTYEVEIDEEDLVTGETDEDDDEGQGGKQLGPEKKPGKNDDEPAEGFESAFKPADAIDPDEESEYAVRRVRLTLRYPNLSDEEAPNELVIVTIFPPLPEDDEGVLSPFETQR